MRVLRVLVICLIVGGLFAAGYWVRLALDPGEEGLPSPDRETASAPSEPEPSAPETADGGASGETVAPETTGETEELATAEGRASEPDETTPEAGEPATSDDAAKGGEPAADGQRDRPADAGPTDTGPTDAGRTDAGPTETGPTDAGGAEEAGEPRGEGQRSDGHPGDREPMSERAEATAEPTAPVSESSSPKVSQPERSRAETSPPDMSRPESVPIAPVETGETGEGERAPSAAAVEAEAGSGRDESAELPTAGSGTARAPPDPAETPEPASTEPTPPDARELEPEQPPSAPAVDASPREPEPAVEQQPEAADQTAKATAPAEGSRDPVEPPSAPTVDASHRDATPVARAEETKSQSAGDATQAGGGRPSAEETAVDRSQSRTSEPAGGRDGAPDRMARDETVGEEMAGAPEPAEMEPEAAERDTDATPSAPTVDQSRREAKPVARADDVGSASAAGDGRQGADRASAAGQGESPADAPKPSDAAGAGQDRSTAGGRAGAGSERPPSEPAGGEATSDPTPQEPGGVETAKHAPDRTERDAEAGRTSVDRPAAPTVDQSRRQAKPVARADDAGSASAAGDGRQGADRASAAGQGESPAEQPASSDAAEAERDRPTAGGGGDTGSQRTPSDSAGGEATSDSTPQEPGDVETAKRAPDRTERDAEAGRDSASDDADEPAADPDADTTDRGERDAPAGDDGGGGGDGGSDVDRKGPSFDVVRVEPGGSAVIAGRAAPNTTVRVLEDGEPIGKTQTNAAGEFVVLPDKRLEVGRSELTLESLTPSGRTRRSEDAVVIATPPGDRGQPDDGGTSGTPSDGGDTPVALKVPRRGSGSAEVMQGPAPETGSDGGEGTTLSFRFVQYTNSGGLVVSGVAEGDLRVRVRLDGRKLGETRADPGDGQWSLVYREDIAPGLYTLKARALDESGSVVARASTPFASQPDVRGLDDDQRLVVVQPGSNLWTIARRTYGEGIQYTTIYRANQDQIADPDLIYPGQVFVLPSENG